MKRKRLRGDGNEGGGFGALLLGWRTKAGLSGRELARRVGVSSAHYSLVEQGRVNPPGDRAIEALAEELRRTPEELYAAAGRVPPVVVQAFLRRPHHVARYCAKVLGPGGDA